MPGELIRVAGNIVAPTEGATRRSGFIEVFGIEVEYFHNYFVGEGESAMLVHNGPSCLPRPVNPGEGHSYPQGTPDTFQARKAYRSSVAQAQHSVHGHKHLQASTEEQAIQYSRGPRGAAQNHPEVNNKTLEKVALEKGFVVEHGGAYHAYIQFDRTVGYDGGQATRWIRAELSGRAYHGHPMEPSRLPKAVRSHFGIKD